MQTFYIGFISGVVSALAVYIFIQSIRKRKGDSPESIEGRIDRNNTNTRSGFEKLKDNNSELEELTRGSLDLAGEGLETLKNTDIAISSIIENAARKRRSTDEAENID